MAVLPLRGDAQAILTRATRELRTCGAQRGIAGETMHSGGSGRRISSTRGTQHTFGWVLVVAHDETSDCTASS